jgi:hypothetical protein
MIKPFRRGGILSPLTSLLLPLLFLTACHRPSLPKDFVASQVPAVIYPDYADVTVPCNIAPLRFELLQGVDEAVTRFAVGSGQEVLCEGIKACPSEDEWHALTTAALGRSIDVEIYVRKGAKWVRLKPFRIHVSNDSIDPWLSYRLISPSYVAYEELTICQRCLENFDERVIVDNMLCSTESGGQCVNCHSYQDRNPRRWQFHARQTHGGTLIAYDDTVRKHQIPGAVYPSWHPSLPLIAYSANKTMQTFHTSDPDKIEVLDSESRLMVYDLRSGQTSPIDVPGDELPTFPCWSPDGRWLYYSSARFTYNPYHRDSVSQKILVDTRTPEQEIAMRSRELKYNIYRVPFDPATSQFGERETVYDAAALDLSATLPRLSPDGRWLLFTVGSYGTFHIWHHDADLFLLNLATGEAERMQTLNSPQAESFHCWSGNSRWVVFSSRRTDGVFTRPFIAHIDSKGKATKPFELPAANPDYHRQLLKSYNVPELMRGPVELTPQQIARILKDTK